MDGSIIIKETLHGVGYVHDGPKIQAVQSGITAYPQVKIANMFT